MNMQEFAALKVGDKIVNRMTLPASTGTVTEITANGVRVVWGAAELTCTFAYPVNTTAWMHWSKAEDDAVTGPFTSETSISRPPTRG